jgi:hypothetical protein
MQAQYLGANLNAWNDLLSQMNIAQSGAGGGAAPTFVKVADNGAGSQGVYLCRFDVAQTFQTVFQMPHGYLEGSDVEAHLHWMSNVNIPATQTVSWTIEYFWQNIGAVKQAATVLENVVTTAPAAAVIPAFTHLVTQFTPISGTGKTISSMLCMSVLRGAGTFANASNCNVFAFDVHVMSTKAGTQRSTLQP